jgi:hypothetical protein
MELTFENFYVEPEGQGPLRRGGLHEEEACVPREGEGGGKGKGGEGKGGEGKGGEGKGGEGKGEGGEAGGLATGTFSETSSR